MAGAQLEQGKLQDALQSYRALAGNFGPHYAKADPNDIGWGVVSRWRIIPLATFNLKQGKLGDALASYTEQLAIARKGGQA